jgi:hypothetical protein
MKTNSEGILDRTIAFTVADSGATLDVGATTDPSCCTRWSSDKQFILPSGDVVPATKIAEHPFNVRSPANELHITPGISQHSLLSTGKFADANYITIFDKDMVNIYDANNTIITVFRGAILLGWHNPDINLWKILLVNMVRNNNTDTIIVNCPPTKILPECPPPSEAIHNVYKLKTQSELVRYHHASAGSPTKST